MNKKTTLDIAIFISCLIAIFVLLLYFVKAIDRRKELDGWLGKYDYAESYEHNSGEMKYVVDYEIIIFKDGKNYYAELCGNGWFLETRSLAYIKGDKNSIDIIFKQTLPGDSLYGVKERYDKDDLLITLTYDNSELQSSWYALQQEHPFLCDSEEQMEGMYFNKY